MKDVGVEGQDFRRADRHGWTRVAAYLHYRAGQQKELITVSDAKLKGKGQTMTRN